MATNKNALLRYKILDECFRNKYKKYTLEMLIDKVSDALYELEGIDNGISKRTIQADIQMMRSDKLGYNAPIIVKENKYYTYDDLNYSIKNIPITEHDMQRMNDALDILKQFDGFDHFRNLTDVVKKIEDHVYVEKSNNQPIIHFEKNELLKGIDFLGALYDYIKNKTVLEITYQSFKAKSASVYTFHGWWLKEFKNRWFIVGVLKKDGMMMSFALDRIIDIKPSKVKYISPTLSPDTYYARAIGATINANAKPSTVVVFVTNEHAPYVETKPIHKSQKVVKRFRHGILIELNVLLNLELQREILGFGDGMIVLSPARLKEAIARKVEKLNQKYVLGNVLKEENLES